MAVTIHVVIKTLLQAEGVGTEGATTELDEAGLGCHYFGVGLAILGK